MKPKVLIIAHSFVVARYRAAVANYLTKDYDVKLLSPEKFPMTFSKMWDYEDSKDEPYEVVRAKTIFTKKSSFFLYLNKIYDLMKNWQPDVIDIFDEAPWAWSVAQIILFRNLFSPKTKIALFVDNNIDRKWKGMRFFYRYFEKYAISNSDKIYVPIEKSGFEKIVRKGGYKGKISYIAGTVDTSLFKPRAKSQVSALRKSLGLSEKDVTLGIIGGLAKYKGYYPKGTPAAIEACAQLPENYKLLLVGSGSPENLEELKELAIKSEVDSSRIIVTGFVPFGKMPLYYNAMNAVLALSVPRSDWAEPCGRMQIEGMSSGIPVIATDCGSNKAIVDKTGFVVKVNDSKAIAKCVLKLINDKRLYRKLSMLARKRAEDVFSTKRMAAKRDKLYKQLLKISNGK
jgi:glycosyltransferase involved in cell wall biosynthesis